MASNRHKGDAFAKGVGEFLKSLGHDIQPEYQVRIGIGPTNKKTHKFDWGNESLLVECKAYNWTESGNVPSAKLTTVNEVMLYFLCAQKPFRKMLFMLTTERRPKGTSETLAEYYLRMNGHLIPDDVEVYEFDPDSFLARKLWPASDQSRQGARGTQEELPSTDNMLFTEGGTKRVLHLKLWKSYYNQGFFNIPREFDHLVEGSIVTLVFGQNSIQATVNRIANRNGTARIMGGAPLRDWFQSNYSEEDAVPVSFEAPTRLNLR